MATTRVLQQSFNGGEVTPEFFGRMDDARRQHGLATMRNFVALPQGPAIKRPGFMFVHEAGDSAARVRLIPFVYSVTQAFAIEMGDGYIRFHANGGTLLAPAAAAWSIVTPYSAGDFAAKSGKKFQCLIAHTGWDPEVYDNFWYELPATGEYQIKSPFAADDVFDIHYAQSNDVLTLVHPDYAPRELRRHGAYDWRLTQISFVPSLDAPSSVAATNTVGAGATTYGYKATAVGDNGLDESLASSSATCTNDLLTTGNYNTVSWAAVTGARRYNVYKEDNGLYGYIGQTDGLSFKDDNITADISRTPPESYNPFSGAGDYPGAVSYFEQRRLFAGTANKPQNVWMTRTGTESNMSYSLPTRDDDSINIRIASRENNSIRHIVPLGDIVLLTNSGEWRVTSVNSDAITPTTVSVKPQSYVGANNVQPLLINTNLVYAEGRGGHVRELAYNWQAGGYVTGDLSIRSPHLFDGMTISDAAYARAPFPVCWFVRDDGVLLGLTYVPDQQVGAWHQHDTDGAFESVCAIPEGNEDAVYVVVKRTVDGNEVRYIERMASRFFAEPEDAFFVDAGLSYSGAPTLTLTGLDHLEGKSVAILADGGVMPSRTVTGGAITLDEDASVVQVGLPVTADLLTLPLAVAMRDGSYGSGRPKNINKLWLRVYRSSGIFAGPDESRLTEYRQRTTEPYGSPPDLKSEEIELVVSPSWGVDGQILVRHAYPLPLTVVCLTMEVVLGG